MQLATTFRGLNQQETAMATRTLERFLGRFERLLDQPAVLRAVIEGGTPEYRVILSIAPIRGVDLNAQDEGHDLAVGIATACERLRIQLLRVRDRRTSGRQRTAHRVAV